MQAIELRRHGRLRVSSCQLVRRLVAMVIACRDTGVLLEHEPDDIEGDGIAVRQPGGWTVRPVGEA